MRVQAVVDVVQEDMFDLAQRVQHGLGIATVVEVALEGAFELLQLRDLSESVSEGEGVSLRPAQTDPAETQRELAGYCVEPQRRCQATNV